MEIENWTIDSYCLFNHETKKQLANRVQKIDLINKLMCNGRKTYENMIKW